MGGENRTKLLTVAMASGAILLIATGAAIAIGTGSVFGWILVGFGAIDLLTGSFVVRKITAKSRDASPTPRADAPPNRTPADPTADPSYNPYARED